MKLQNNKIKICAFTSSRADFGILSGLLNEIKNNNNFNLQIIASGSHLFKKYGETYKEIENCGFKISKKIKILLPGHSQNIISLPKAISNAISKYAKAILDLKSDLILLLGDRFETFAMAIAAVTCQIPIIHLHGGELTYGSMDEYFRHAITKMSSLHFATTDEYKNRIIQMGENPEFVFNFGALGVENIKKIKLLNKSEVEQKLNFKINPKTILVTYHPITINTNNNENVNELFLALNELKDLNIIFTMPNADFGHLKIASLIKKFVQKNSNRSIWVHSLGQQLYFSLLNLIDAVVGNSSSGIIEAPSFKIGTINIGSRQDGRVRSDSIIDCKMNKQEIIKAFQKLYSKSFQDKLKTIKNKYEGINTAKNITNTIVNLYPKLKTLKTKIFYDIKFK